MSSATSEKPKPYTLGRTEGGKFPDFGNLFSATLGEFVDHLGDYVMLGLGQMLIVFPAAFFLIFLLYGGITVLILGGVMGSGALGALVAEGAGDDTGALVMLGGTALTALATIAAFFALILGFAALLAPVGASVTRAIARHQRGEGKLTFQDAFATYTQDLLSVFAIAAILVTGTLVGLCFCYLPGLAFGMLLSMAPPMVYLHRQPAMTAFRVSLRDLTANAGWYLQFAVIYFAVAMIASYVPILGPMFLTSLHVRAYRERFGDADEPLLDAAT